MASFADQRPATFNPYIEQIPTDAYVTVGMQQQRKYDDNVQTIQSYISSLTDLPVMKGADSQYLNGRVAEFTTKLNNVASSDWANTSMLTQAGSLAAAIYKDPNVQNAVLSTQRIKQLQESYKDLRDKHPDQYSAINEAYDMENSVGAYLNNNSVGELYNGPTNATIGTVNDVTKRLTDMVSKVKANKTTTINPLGEMMYQVDEKTWVSEDQIKSMVQKQLSAQDLDLLHREAWYNLKGYSPTQLMNRYVQNSDNEIKARSRQIDQRTTANALIKDSYIKNLDAQDIQQMKDMVNDLTSYRNDYVTKYKTGKLNESDISQMRDQMWNSNYISGIAEFGSYTQNSVDLKVNEEAKFAIEKNFQREMNAAKFQQDLVTTLAGKHPEVLSIDSEGKVTIDMAKLASITSGAGGGMMSPIAVNPDDEGVSSMISEASISKEIESATNEKNQARGVIISYLRNVPEYTDYFDNEGNPKTDPESTAKLDEAISIIARQIKQKADGIPVTVPFMPKNVNQQRILMNAALKAQESQLKIDAAMNLENQADLMAAQRASIDPNFDKRVMTVHGADGSVKSYSLKDLAALSEPLSYSSGGVGEYGAPPHPVYKDEFRNILSGPDGRQVMQEINKISRFTELKNREKPGVYRDLSRTNVPLARTIALPEKNTDPTYIGVQNALQAQIGNAAEAGSIRPIQAYQTGGKKFIIAQYKPSDAQEAKKGLVTQLVDVTSLVNNSPNTWASDQFGSDPNPELTNTIERLPGRKTPLNKNNGFKGALFTDNFDTVHYYSIMKAGQNDFGKVPGRYYLTIAVPSPDGKTATYEDIVKDFVLPADAQRFVNGIFATQESTDNFYKTLQEKNQ